MATPIVLNCSHPGTGSSAEWTTTLRNSVQLDDGDTLRVKQALLKTNATDSSTLIELEADVPVEITHGYYVHLYDRNSAAGNIVTNDPVDVKNPHHNYYNQYYVAWTPASTNVFRWGDDAGQPYKVLRNTVRFTIAAGSYEPIQLQQRVNQELNELKFSTFRNKGYFSSKNGLYIDTYNQGDAGLVHGLSSNGPVTWWEAGALCPHNSIHRGLVFSTWSTPTATGLSGIHSHYSDIFNDSFGVLAGCDSAELEYSTAKQRFEFKKLHTAPRNTAGSLPTVSTVIEAVDLTAGGINTIDTRIAVRFDDGTSTLQLEVTDDPGIYELLNANPTLPMVHVDSFGTEASTTVTITSVDETTGVLTLTQPNDGWFAVNNRGYLTLTQQNPSYTTSYSKVEDMSGIFLMNLEPRAFWEDVLGFDVSSITAGVPQHYSNISFGNQTRAGEFGPSYDAFFRSKTKQLMPLSALINQGTLATMANIPGSIKYIASGENDVLPLTAPNHYKRVQAKQSDGGYFLELLQASQQQAFDHEGRSTMMGLVSNNYAHNGWISGYENSSLTYVHSGLPLALTQLTIRIKDTSGELAEADMESQHIVLLEVVKASKQAN